MGQKWHATHAPKEGEDAYVMCAPFSGARVADVVLFKMKILNKKILNVTGV